MSKGKYELRIVMEDIEDKIDLCYRFIDLATHLEKQELEECSIIGEDWICDIYDHQKKGENK